MKDQFNPDEANKYRQYLDSKNLYGCAVIQKLPTFEFAWEKVDSFLLLKNWWKNTDSGIF